MTKEELRKLCWEVWDESYKMYTSESYPIEDRKLDFEDWFEQYIQNLNISII